MHAKRRGTPAGEYREGPPCLFSPPTPPPPPPFPTRTSHIDTNFGPGLLPFPSWIIMCLGLLHDGRLPHELSTFYFYFSYSTWSLAMLDRIPPICKASTMVLVPYFLRLRRVQTILLKSQLIYMMKPYIYTKEVRPSFSFYMWHFK